MLRNNRFSLHRAALLWAAVLVLALGSGFVARAEDEVNIPKANAKLLDMAAAGDLEGVRDALRDGAELNTSDKWGRTALHHALFRHHQELAIYLVNQGADLTLTDKEYGATPLHLAGMMGLKDAVRVMVKKSPDPFAKTKTGWIPQHWAGALGEEGCCSGDMLKEYGWEHIMTPHKGIISETILNEVKSRAKSKDFSCNCWCEADANVQWQKAGCCAEARWENTVTRSPLGPDKDCEKGTCSWNPYGSANNGAAWGSCMAAPPIYDWWDGDWRHHSASDFRIKGAAWYESPWIGRGCGAGPGGTCTWTNPGTDGSWRSGLKAPPTSQWPYWERAGASPCGLSEPPHDPSRRNLSCELYPSELSDTTIRTQCCTHKREDGKLVRRVKIWQTRPHTHTDGNNKSFTHTHPFFEEIEVEIE